MRVLFTNNTLSLRAGTECFVRDLAIEYLNRGHQPLAYSSNLGAVAEELRDKSIPVVDDLSLIGQAPDIIHAQHHLDAVAALLRFPDTPAIYVCHGWRPWEEHPPTFPRILRYVAIDHATHDRLVLENGIPNENVEIIPNFVDISRFRNRESLPSKIERALIFSNYVTRDSLYFKAVSEACERNEIQLDVIGSNMGTEIDCPGEKLADYDLVFAQGRSALEAMVAGTAVMICSSRAFGPLVGHGNFEYLRERNFGIRTLLYPPSPTFVLNELSKYNPTEAHAISERVRKECTLKNAVDKFLKLYGEVIHEHKVNRYQPADDTLAASKYVQGVSRNYKGMATTFQRYADLYDAFVDMKIINSGLELEKSHYQNINAQVERENIRLRDQVECLQINEKNIRAKNETITTSLTWRVREQLLHISLVRQLWRAFRWTRGIKSA